MAPSRVLLACVLVLVLVLGFAESNSTVEPQKVVVNGGPSIDCGSACAVRCQLSSRPNLCKRACGSCCSRCSCVPPGTSGNYNMCPCYAAITTRGGRLKCP